MTLLENIKKELEGRNDRSAWDKGVTVYALELVESLQENENAAGVAYESLAAVVDDLKNGATDWAAYSWGGCALIYDGDICARLATPSEQKKKDGGRLAPNSREQWLDTQARALYQAERRIKNAGREIMRQEAA